MIILYEILDLLIRGTASDVFGMESDTWLRNTVSDRSTVTSEMRESAVHSYYFVKLSSHFTVRNSGDSDGH